MPKDSDEQKKRGEYVKHSDGVIECFITSIIDGGLSVPKAAKRFGIARSTAYRIHKEYKDNAPSMTDSGDSKKQNNRKGPKLRLPEMHTAYITQYVDEKPTATLKDITDDLCGAFEGLKVSVSAVHRYMSEKCNLSSKWVEKLPAKRNSEKVIKARKEKVQSWMNNDVDFATNCVSVDESGFNLHIARYRACEILVIKRDREIL